MNRAGLALNLHIFARLERRSTKNLPHASSVYFRFYDPERATFSIYSNDDPFDARSSVKISIEVGGENYRLHPIYNKTKTGTQLTFLSMEGPKIAKAFEKNSPPILKISGKPSINLELENANLIFPEMLECLSKLESDVTRQNDPITLSSYNDYPKDDYSVTSKRAILRFPLYRLTHLGNYPTRAVREARGGTVGFVLSVNEKGRASNCSIVRSSGHEDIDRSACRLLPRYARFLPATDDTGKPTNSVYQGDMKFSSELVKGMFRGSETWCPQPVTTIN